MRGLSKEQKVDSLQNAGNHDQPLNRSTVHGYNLSERHWTACPLVKLGAVNRDYSDTIVVDPSAVGLAALARMLNFDWDGQDKDLDIFANHPNIGSDSLSEEGRNVSRIIDVLPPPDDPYFERFLSNAVWLFLQTTPKEDSKKRRAARKIFPGWLEHGAQAQEHARTCANPHIHDASSY